MATDMFWGGAPLPDPEDDPTGDNENVDEDEFGFDISDDSENKEVPQVKARRKAAQAKLRVPGGIAPTSKRITVDYDSDDGRIIELKQQLYTDEYVAQTLQAEGRVRYQAKTVGSRWQRLRKMLFDKDDERLDDELTDWHVEEDDPLNSIVADVEQKYAKQRENLENKKWQEISLHLAEKIGKRKYTGKACRERYEGLRDGSALLPIELDNDKEGRRKMREERVARNKQARVDAENAVKQAETAKTARQLAKKRERDDAEQARVAALAKRRAEKAERERIKEERRLNKEQAAQRRRDMLDHMKLQRDWEITKRQAERELCRQLSGGKGLDGKPARAPGRKKKNGCYSDDEDEDDFINDLESDEDDEEEHFHLPDTDDEDDAANSENVNSGEEYTPRPTRRRRSRKATAKKPSAPKITRMQIEAAGDVPGLTIESTREKSKAFVSVFNKAPVSKESLLNPRSVMSNDELDSLLTFRELPRRNDETHAEVVSRIAFADEDLKGPEIDALLASHFIKAKGLKKVDKIRQLREADAARSEQGQMGIVSTDPDFMRGYEGYSGPFAALVEQAGPEKGDGGEDRRDSQVQ